MSLTAGLGHSLRPPALAQFPKMLAGFRTSSTSARPSPSVSGHTAEPKVTLKLSKAIVPPGAAAFEVPTSKLTRVSAVEATLDPMRTQSLPLRKKPDNVDPARTSRRLPAVSVV